MFSTKIFLLVLLCNIYIDSVSGDCKSFSASNGTNNCGKCVGESLNCYWCSSTNKCADRPSVIVGNSECSGKWYSWGQCTVPGVVLVIVVPIIAFLLLVIIGCCLYCICCRDCCRARKEKKWAKEDSRRENRKKEREERYAARDEERKLKHDQIRMKYGLFKDDQTPYQKFDAS